MRVAYMQASNSQDPRTKNGALVVAANGYQLLAVGHNRIVPAVLETPERLADRQTKLKYITHAEAYAVCQVARCGHTTEGATMVATWAACVDCAKLIVAAGIGTVVRHRHAAQSRPEWERSLAADDDQCGRAEQGPADQYVHPSVLHQVLLDGLSEVFSAQAHAFDAEVILVLHLFHDGDTGHLTLLHGVETLREVVPRGST
jgi:dCMP deaminase